ncbi:MAG TPA: DUF5683 domain-containing protein [Methanoregula sp.]|nr:DUF5683 domain-containing protein [Methanoregula sp.]
MAICDPLPPDTRNPRLATLLSAICPGLGQAYNYQIIRGLVFLIVFILFIPFVIPSFFLWIVTIRDAYMYAQELNKDTRSGFLMRGNDDNKKPHLSEILRRS